MVYILKGNQIEKVAKIKHTVDDQTVIIGQDTPESEKASPQETRRMLEETLDQASGETKSVYEKIYRGVTKYN
jgi:hypothetical protein